MIEDVALTAPVVKWIMAAAMRLSTGFTHQAHWPPISVSCMRVIAKLIAEVGEQKGFLCWNPRIQIGQSEPAINKGREPTKENTADDSYIVPEEDLHEGDLQHDERCCEAGHL